MGVRSRSVARVAGVHDEHRAASPHQPERRAQAGQTAADHENVKLRRSVEGGGTG